MSDKPKEVIAYRDSKGVLHDSLASEKNARALRIVYSKGITTPGMFGLSFRSEGMKELYTLLKEVYDE